MSFSVYEDGPRVRITAEYPDDHEGLYKAYLQGTKGRVLMGTLAPEHGRLRISRTFSVDSLRRDDVWPLENVDIVLSYPAPVSSENLPDGWSHVERLSTLMSDDVLKQSSSSVQNALIHQEENGFLIAIPFTGSFELSPLFCLAAVRSMEGKDYSVFTFNQKGIPVLPHNAN